MVNLDTVELLWRATLAAVAEAAVQAIADAGHQGGFILGSGCEVPMATPRENVKAMIATAHLK
jgi:uroporphyrinogen decarboxylase